MRPLFLIDAIDRDSTEDPVYLDKEKTIGNNHIVLTLGDRGRLLSSRNKNRILGICFWKFIKGYYFTKDWEEFLGRPISSDGIIFAETTCPDSFCGNIILRDPRDSMIFCKKCERNYSHPYSGPLAVAAFGKYIKKMTKFPFCEGCGKLEIEWTSSDTKLCGSCFKKHGDISFKMVDSGTKFPFPPEIILSGRGG